MFETDTGTTSGVAGKVLSLCLESLCLEGDYKGDYKGACLIVT